MPLRAATLARYASPAVARRYLRFLAGAGLVVRTGRGRFRLAEPRIASFGATLEWYVAELLAREFEAIAYEPSRLEREIWRVGPEIYLLNADPDLGRNLGTCLAAHFRERGIALG